MLKFKFVLFILFCSVPTQSIDPYTNQCHPDDAPMSNLATIALSIGPFMVVGIYERIADMQSQKKKQ